MYKSVIYFICPRSKKYPFSPFYFTQIAPWDLIKQNVLQKGLSCVHNSPPAHILHFQYKPHKYNNQTTIELTFMYKMLHLY